MSDRADDGPLIIAANPPHDAAIAAAQGGRLLFSIETEKDNKQRHLGTFTAPELAMLMSRLPDVPQVMAFAGLRLEDRGYQAGYHGTVPAATVTRQARIFGRPVTLFHTTHERSHLFCSYGLSPFEQGRPVHALVWEGFLGGFYTIASDMSITSHGTVLPNPGARYSLPFLVAEPTSSTEPYVYDLSAAGKMLALAAGESEPDDAARWKDEAELFLAGDLHDGPTAFQTLRTLRLRSRLSGIGQDNDEFRSFARYYSQVIFGRFYRWAAEHLREGFPLLIAGGCGLNCNWNTQWLRCGLFSEVFVPPCTNDSGAAIGAAADAQFAQTGSAKLSWTVYAGEEFVTDCTPPPSYREHSLDLAALAEKLAAGAILGWVQGRYELGPRALAHRSIIASPFSAATRDRINHLKQRALYRPVAPMCTEESVSRYFEWSGPSPYMLHFQRVRPGPLAAVTHFDGSARVQTVSAGQDERVHALLSAFGAVTGHPVLCNTSLNGHGRGLINRMSDLVRFSTARELDGFVVGDKVYLRA